MAAEKQPETRSRLGSSNLMLAGSTNESDAARASRSRLGSSLTGAGLSSSLNQSEALDETLKLDGRAER